MPWFVVGLSMYASLLSTIAYLSEPGEFIKNGPGVWGRQLHVPFTLTLAILVLIPFFMRRRLTSAYEYLKALRLENQALRLSPLPDYSIVHDGDDRLHGLHRYVENSERSCHLGGPRRRTHRHRVHHSGRNSGGDVDGPGAVHDPLRGSPIHHRLR